MPERCVPCGDVIGSGDCRSRIAGRALAGGTNRRYERESVAAGRVRRRRSNVCGGIIPYSDGNSGDGPVAGAE